ncbi:MAG: hypothetical protein RSC11_01400 [Mucinivorans sp.]
MKKIFCSLMIALVVACSSIKDIPDDEMVDIITQALLTTSFASPDFGVPSAGSSNDTIDFYTPILERYGYTLDDFRSTIYDMSTRKSNPLNNIFGQVTLGIDSMAAVAEYRYNVSLRYDTLALNFYADTVYLKDTTIRGSLSKFKIKLLDIRQGTYTLSFDYKNNNDYRAGTKAVGYRTGDRQAGTTIAPLVRTWIDRAKDTTRFVNRADIKAAHDTLLYVFEEPQLDKSLRGKVKDSSFISNVKIVYTPELEKAREDYFRRNFKKIQIYKIIQNEKDSLSVRARQRWTPKAVGSGELRQQRDRSRSRISRSFGL